MVLVNARRNFIRLSYLFVILVEDGGTLVGTSCQDPARVVRVHVEGQNTRHTGRV